MSNFRGLLHLNAIEQAEGGFAYYHYGRHGRGHVITRRQLEIISAARWAMIAPAAFVVLSIAGVIQIGQPMQLFALFAMFILGPLAPIVVLKNQPSANRIVTRAELREANARHAGYALIALQIACGLGAAILIISIHDGSMIWWIGSAGLAAFGALQVRDSLRSLQFLRRRLNHEV